MERSIDKYKYRTENDHIKFDQLILNSVTKKTPLPKNYHKS